MACTFQGLGPGPARRVGLQRAAKGWAVLAHAGETVRKPWEEMGQLFAPVSLLLPPKADFCTPLFPARRKLIGKVSGTEENLKGLDMEGQLNVFMPSATFRLLLLPLQFQILRKLSQEPVATAIPSAVTPRQLTLLS